MTRSLQLLTTGPQVLVQDLGRPGWAHLGVGRSGAADRGALRLANRLVGNPEGAAGLEVLLGSTTLRLRGGGVVAVTGARIEVGAGERSGHQDGPLAVGDGDVLRLGPVARGLRAYVAVRGGLAGPATLGSRSTDTLSGLGPAPLRPGDVVAVGPAPEAWPDVDQAPVASTTDPLVLRAVAGPRDDWFVAEALRVLVTATWRVGGDTDRVGTRLEGPELVRRTGGELASEGMVRGAVQVPPHGRPVVMGADHPVTGGYPVLVTVLDTDTDLLAQARPGDAVCFRLR